MKQLIGGQAYERATTLILGELPAETREQFKEVLIESLKRTWYVAIAFSALGFLLVILEKGIPLRQELDTEYGMVEKEKEKTSRDKAAGEGMEKETLDSSKGPEESVWTPWGAEE